MINKKIVMILEDDIDLAEGIELSLKDEKLNFIICNTIAEARKALTLYSFDLLIFDINLPDGNGIEFCRELKKEMQIPIALLTAKSMEMDIVKGLENGADDYITKPFNILEVKARMKAILRRNAVTEKKAAKNNIINAGDMKIDCDSRNLYIAGRPINLTAKEFDLLELLAVNPGKVYSRDNLLKAVWGQDYSGDGRTVDVHMRRLREKIEDNPSEPKYVHTKWGVGYYFNV